ncbi:MAG: hypothetical protein IKZ19_00360 [Clostridia bacterium]|nr:hypothetical protein [Clostridia bacterium]
MNLQVDFTKTLGPVKPMHGMGQPPFSGIDFSMTDYLKEANVPFSRLHDVGGPYGGNIYVDIPNIFRDFSADETDPKSYDFAFTDLLIGQLVSRGIEPFYRLGVTIENYRCIKALRINPPEDFEKWARICEMIIRHYTEGWADGFNYRITYWEIWNEPDNYETPEENQMWTGTPLQYYQLYHTAATHLKKCFPHLKIGGYASCGFYALTGSDNSFGACSPRFQFFIDFFNGFMDYIVRHGSPLDFFSWHSYSGIEDNVRWASYVRKRLDEAGCTHTEHTLNEWNCCPDKKGTLRHAALTAGMMLALQNTSLDSAMFYDARWGSSIYGGLFDTVKKCPTPTYYGVLGFGRLYALGCQTALTGLSDGVYGISAAKDDRGALLLANTNEAPVPLDLEVSGAKKVSEVRIICEGRIWEETELPNTLPENSVVYAAWDR